MKVKGMLRGLLLAYGLTGIMLLLLAFLLFRFDLKENMVSMGIVLVYILSCFLGGILAGKYARTRKYLWGSCLLAVPETIGYVHAAYTDNAVHVPGRGNAGRYDFLKKYFEKAGRCDILTMLS